MSSEEDELLRNTSVSEYDYDYDENDDDTESGAGSDDFDLLESGEIGEELCQVGSQYCSIPFELYDLHDLTEILSVDSWNNCLTEEERFSLSEYLPAMDQSTFMDTLKELLSGGNFHFGSPMIKFFDMLKGGLCEPRVALYRQSLNFFQNRRHYHLLREYQNSMVANFNQMRDAWKNSKGYGIGERLYSLNLMRNQGRLMYEKMDDSGSETKSSGTEEFDDGLWTKRMKSLKLGSKMGDRAVSRYGKKNAKGVLKFAVSKVPSNHHGLGTTARPYASKYTLPQQEPVIRYDSRIVNGITLERDQSSAYVYKKAKGGLFKPEKKHTLLKTEDCFNFDRKLTKKQIEERDSHYLDKPHQPAVGGWINTASGAQHLLLEGNRLDCSIGSQPLWHSSRQAEDFSMDCQRNFDDWDIKSKKWNMCQEFETGINNMGHDPKVKSYRAFPPQVNDRLFSSNYTAKTSQEEIKRESVQNGGRNMEELRGMGMYTHNDDTDSEPSTRVAVEENINPSKDNTFVGKDKDDSCMTPEVMHSSEMGNGRKKGKTPDSHYLHNDATRDLVNNGHMLLECDEKLQFPAERKQKGRFNRGYPLPQSNYMQDYSDNEDELHVTPRLGKRGNGRPRMSLSGCNLLTKKWNEKPDVTYRDALDESSLLNPSPQNETGEPSMMKKPGKGNMEIESDSLVKSVTPEVLIAERGSADLEPETKPALPFTLITPTVHTSFSFSVIHLLSAVRVALITPLAEDFLEAGRVTEKCGEVQKPKKEEQTGKHESLKKVPFSHTYENMDACVSAQAGQKKFPSLTVQEIVNRVRSNPGDPSILETLEPLQDLVRGVLKIFSSKTAPLGAKGWKTLIFYEKTSKSWSWVGPVSSSSSNPDTVEEKTSAMAWGLPHKLLVKLVDSYANWLKNGQETLQQIGSLPAPPLMLMQPNLDVKDRFRDLRAQKSLSTISPSSEEARAYFRKEEALRYLVPERAFSYTAADGRKSIVAPLRRCGGKLTSKIRDHFMLKPDRPPHVTVLCIVRDAAARLPGGIGTRADVCILIRDSQYIVENVEDAQVNQVVSGAMDRLHYELDPCIQFDNDRKFWIYLHRGREEEDFEDNGTSSTKKWKRPRKVAPEQSDLGTITDAYHGNGEQLIGGSSAASALGSNLNAKPSSIFWRRCGM